MPDECIHKLNNAWTLWLHLPHDTNWDINSYKKIYTFSYLEEAIALFNNIEDNLVLNCMLFIMREDIQPIWEDEKNKNGSCMSYKINNRLVYNIWKEMSLFMIGESLINNIDVQKNINGLTVSPKKNFCIIKLWFSDGVDEKTNIEINNINNINELKNFDGIFKKHI